MIQPDKVPGQKEFSYYPSLSAGASKNWLMKNHEIQPGISSRFYTDEYPEKWRSKYFLITAGHHYKNMNTNRDFGCEGAQVLGDSGGFQLATGAINWDPSFKETIFKWLETNSDIAMNLDLPPRVKLEGKFDYCLDISLENFKYFEENQTGKTAFLNVLQGNEEETYRYWYEKVKAFDFQGWGFGNCRRIDHLMYALAIMIKEKEFLKDSCKFLHILGASKVYDFVIYEYLQKIMNKYTGGKVQVSTDSSSPGLMSVYGGYYFNTDYRTGTFLTAHFGRPTDVNYNLDAPLPCKLDDCVACKGKTYRDIVDFKTPSYMTIVHHNLHIFIDAVNTIKTTLQSHDEILKDIVDPMIYQLCMCIKEMFESTDPFTVYQKYKPLYSKYNAKYGMRELGYARGSHPSANTEVVNTFFDFE